MAAIKFEEPELALSPEEANSIATAVVEVQKHYPLDIDPKMVAWGQLAMALAMVYGPKAYNIYSKKKGAEKQ